MRKNEKDLLLQDICARLPYGVVVGTTDNDGTIPNFWSLDMYNRLTDDVRLTNCEIDADRLTDVCDVRPYLFPLSSMTKEQKHEYNELVDGMFGTNVLINFGLLGDFFYRNHLDCNGLIPA